LESSQSDVSVVNPEAQPKHMLVIEAFMSPKPSVSPSGTQKLTEHVGQVLRFSQFPEPSQLPLKHPPATEAAVPLGVLVHWFPGSVPPAAKPQVPPWQAWQVPLHPLASWALFG
jgi:hypothetical protein